MSNDPPSPASSASSSSSSPGILPRSELAALVAAAAASSSSLSRHNLLGHNLLEQGDTDIGVDRISSKFCWDQKVVIWEVLSISVAAGGPNSTVANPNLDPTDPQEYAAMLDIDYMTSSNFHAGHHDQNKSTWSLSLYKTGADTLGVFIHLLQLNGTSRSVANRRSNSNQNSTNSNTNHGSGIYFKYAMCLVNTDGEVVNKIENDTIINILPGQSWGEDEFIILHNLWDADLKLVHHADQEKLIVRVDLSLLSALDHTHEVYSAPTVLTSILTPPATPPGSEPPRKFPRSKSAAFTIPPVKTSNNGFQFGGGCGGKSWPISTTSASLSSPILQSLWNLREFADVQIHCGGRTFPVHKCVISAASPVFKLMFSTQMSESVKGEVEITDLDATVMETVFYFMYTQLVPTTWDWTNFEKSAELVHAAEKYGLKELKSMCFVSLCEKLDCASVPGVAVLAQMYSAEGAVKEFVAKFIIRNIQRLKNDSNFNDSLEKHPTAFTTILLSDALSKSVSTVSTITYL